MALSKVSVVICAHNEERLIAEAIRSVEKQVTDFPVEIIVVDNASSDKTASIAKELGAKVILQPKKGLCYARQAGLDAVNSEILVYVDADTRLSKGWLQAVIDYFEAHPGVVGVSCTHHYYHASVFERTGLIIFNTFVPVFNRIMRFFHRPEMFLGLVMAMRTDAIRKAGGIDQNFVFYGEDVVMSLRLNTQGEVRYLQNLHVLASGRTLALHKVLKTLFLYWGMFLLLELGRYKMATAVSKRYS